MEHCFSLHVWTEPAGIRTETAGKADASLLGAFFFSPSTLPFELKLFFFHYS
jgi:hypothetical protein